MKNQKARLARDTIEKMLAEIVNAVDFEQAKFRCTVAHGAARLAYVVGLIEWDEWEKYDEAGEMALRKYRATRRASTAEH